MGDDAPGNKYCSPQPQNKEGGPGGPISCFLPPLRQQIRDTSKSVTSQSYSPLEVPDGKQPLPWNLHQITSSYGREKLNPGPHSKEVSAGSRLDRSEPQDVCSKTGRVGSSSKLK